MKRPSQNLIIKYLHNFWNSKLVTSCLLCLFLGIANTALAEYQKPKNGDAPDANSTNISGIRTGSEGEGGGCSKREKTNLTALAPYSHVGQTVSPHPTFVWFVPDREPYPLEFQLYEYDASNPYGKGDLTLKVALESQSGIMSYSIPENQLGLSSEQRYVWQVAVVCDPNSPLQSLVVSAETKVVRMPATLATQLENMSDPLTKADLYAEAGMWYDAIAEVVNGSNNPQAREFTFQLIEQLANMEKLDNASNIEKQTKIIRVRYEQEQRLKKIIEANNSPDSPNPQFPKPLNP